MDHHRSLELLRSVESNSCGHDPFSLLHQIMVVIEDVNDNPPVFPQDTINTGIPESATPGSLVEVVSAMDADYGSNAALTYQKTAGDPESKSSCRKSIKIFCSYFQISLTSVIPVQGVL